MRKAIVFFTKYRTPRSGESSGQSIVELGLILPTLVIIIAGILDLGRIYYSYVTVINSAREGARFGATHPPALLPCGNHAGDIILRAQNEAQASGIDPNMLVVKVDCPDAGSDANKLGHPVRVEVTYNFYPILTRMLFGAGPVKLKSDAQMQIYAQ